MRDTPRSALTVCGFWSREVEAVRNYDTDLRWHLDRAMETASSMRRQLEAMQETIREGWVPIAKVDMVLADALVPYTTDGGYFIGNDVFEEFRQLVEDMLTRSEGGAHKG